jgi:dTDP-4-amino-4,6-dideoxygalactose transaminase
MTAFHIPFQDFRAPYHELKEELDAAYHRFMESGWLVLGKETTAFEEEYAAYCAADHCVGISNGLEALHLALRAMGCGPGDEVIVPSNTYIATWLAVSQVGARPVPVEPDPTTFNIDPARVEEAITSKTKVIMAVNLYGQPCDYDALIAIANKHGLRLAIDNAQAHGCKYKGKVVGALADIECHSFYPSKNLGAFVEAGAITTNDSDLADRIRILRNYGSRVRYCNEIQGYNARIDELQAAFLRVKLRKLDEWNNRRSSIAEQYLSQLSAFSSELSLPFVPEWSSPVWHLFVIRHPHRDRLQKHLAEHGIQTIIHYPIPPHMSGAYSDLQPPTLGTWQLPIAEQLAKEVLSLPIGPYISQVAAFQVISAIGSFPSNAF